MGSQLGLLLLLCGLFGCILPFCECVSLNVVSVAVSSPPAISFQISAVTSSLRSRSFDISNKLQRSRSIPDSMGSFEIVSLSFQESPTKAPTISPESLSLSSSQRHSLLFSNSVSQLASQVSSSNVVSMVASSSSTSQGSLSFQVSNAVSANPEMSKSYSHLSSLVSNQIVSRRISNVVSGSMELSTMSGSMPISRAYYSQFSKFVNSKSMPASSNHHSTIFSTASAVSFPSVSQDISVDVSCGASQKVLSLHSRIVSSISQEYSVSIEHSIPSMISDPSVSSTQAISLRLPSTSTVGLSVSSQDISQMPQISYSALHSAIYSKSSKALSNDVSSVIVSFASSAALQSVSDNAQFSMIKSMFSLEKSNHPVSLSTPSMSSLSASFSKFSSQPVFSIIVTGPSVHVSINSMRINCASYSQHFASSDSVSSTSPLSIIVSRSLPGISITPSLSGSESGYVQSSLSQSSHRMPSLSQVRFSHKTSEEVSVVSQSYSLCALSLSESQISVSGIVSLSGSESSMSLSHSQMMSLTSQSISTFGPSLRQQSISESIKHTLPFLSAKYSMSQFTLEVHSANQISESNPFSFTIDMSRVGSISNVNSLPISRIASQPNSEIVSTSTQFSFFKSAFSLELPSASIVSPNSMVSMSASIQNSNSFSLLASRAVSKKSLTHVHISESNSMIIHQSVSTVVSDISSSSHVKSLLTSMKTSALLSNEFSELVSLSLLPAQSQSMRASSVQLSGISGVLSSASSVLAPSTSLCAPVQASLSSYDQSGSIRVSTIKSGSYSVAFSSKASFEISRPVLSISASMSKQASITAVSRSSMVSLSIINPVSTFSGSASLSEESQSAPTAVSLASFSKLHQVSGSSPSTSLFAFSKTASTSQQAAGSVESSHFMSGFSLELNSAIILSVSLHVSRSLHSKTTSKSFSGTVSGSRVIQSQSYPNSYSISASINSANSLPGSKQYSLTPSKLVSVQLTSLSIPVSASIQTSVTGSLTSQSISGLSNIRILSVHSSSIAITTVQSNSVTYSVILSNTLSGSSSAHVHSQQQSFSTSLSGDVSQMSLLSIMNSHVASSMKSSPPGFTLSLAQISNRVSESGMHSQLSESFAIVSKQIQSTSSESIPSFASFSFDVSALSLSFSHFVSNVAVSSVPVSVSISIYVSRTVSRKSLSSELTASMAFSSATNSMNSNSLHSLSSSKPVSNVRFSLSQHLVSRHSQLSTSSVTSMMASTHSMKSQVLLSISPSTTVSGDLSLASQQFISSGSTSLPISQQFIISASSVSTIVSRRLMSGTTSLAISKQLLSASTAVSHGLLSGSASTLLSQQFLSASTVVSQGLMSGSASTQQFLSASTTVSQGLMSGSVSMVVSQQFPSVSISSQFGPSSPTTASSTVSMLASLQSSPSNSLMYSQGRSLSLGSTASSELRSLSVTSMPLNSLSSVPKSLQIASSTSTDSSLYSHVMSLSFIPMSSMKSNPVSSRVSANSMISLQYISVSRAVFSSDSSTSSRINSHSSSQASVMKSHIVSLSSDVASSMMSSQANSLSLSQASTMSSHGVSSSITAASSMMSSQANSFSSSRASMMNSQIISLSFKTASSMMSSQANSFGLSRVSMMNSQIVSLSITAASSMMSSQANSFSSSQASMNSQFISLSKKTASSMMSSQTNSFGLSRASMMNSQIVSLSITAASSMMNSQANSFSSSQASMMNSQGVSLSFTASLTISSQANSFSSSRASMMNSQFISLSFKTASSMMSSQANSFSSSRASMMNSQIVSLSITAASSMMSSQANSMMNSQFISLSLTAASSMMSSQPNSFSSSRASMMNSQGVSSSITAASSMMSSQANSFSSSRASMMNSQGVSLCFTAVSSMMSSQANSLSSSRASMMNSQGVSSSITAVSSMMSSQANSFSSSQASMMNSQGVSLSFTAASSMMSSLVSSSSSQVSMINSLSLTAASSMMSSQVSSSSSLRVSVINSRGVSLSFTAASSIMHSQTSSFGASVASMKNSQVVSLCFAASSMTTSQSISLSKLSTTCLSMNSQFVSVIKSAKNSQFTHSSASTASSTISQMIHSLSVNSLSKTSQRLSATVSSMIIFSGVGSFGSDSILSIYSQFQPISLSAEASSRPSLIVSSAPVASSTIVSQISSFASIASVSIFNSGASSTSQLVSRSMDLSALSNEASVSDYASSVASTHAMSSSHFLFSMGYCLSTKHVSLTMELSESFPSFSGSISLRSMSPSIASVKQMTSQVSSATFTSQFDSEKLHSAISSASILSGSSLASFVAFSASTSRVHVSVSKRTSLGVRSESATLSSAAKSLSSEMLSLSREVSMNSQYRPQSGGSSNMHQSTEMQSHSFRSSALQSSSSAVMSISLFLSGLQSSTHLQSLSLLLTVQVSSSFALFSTSSQPVVSFLSALNSQSFESLSTRKVSGALSSGFESFPTQSMALNSHSSILSSHASILFSFNSEIFSGNSDKSLSAQSNQYESIMSHLSIHHRSMQSFSRPIASSKGESMSQLVPVQSPTNAPTVISNLLSRAVTVEMSSRNSELFVTSILSHISSSSTHHFSVYSPTAAPTEAPAGSISMMLSSILLFSSEKRSFQSLTSLSAEVFSSSGQKSHDYTSKSGTFLTSEQSSFSMMQFSSGFGSMLSLASSSISVSRLLISMSLAPVSSESLRSKPIHSMSRGSISSLSVPFSASYSFVPYSSSLSLQSGDSIRSIGQSSAKSLSAALGSSIPIASHSASMLSHNFIDSISQGSSNLLSMPSFSSFILFSNSASMESIAHSVRSNSQSRSALPASQPVFSSSSSIFSTQIPSTGHPTKMPTQVPSHSAAMTSEYSGMSTAVPTTKPTKLSILIKESISAILSANPISKPPSHPIEPTRSPTLQPTIGTLSLKLSTNLFSTPSHSSLVFMSNSNSGVVDKEPTAGPTVLPSRLPTNLPTSSLSHGSIVANSREVFSFAQSLSSPTVAPVLAPVAIPTLYPSVLPSVAPTVGLSIRFSLGSSHSATTSNAISAISGTLIPTFAPSRSPSVLPTINPTAAPTHVPTDVPSAIPTIASEASIDPSTCPTAYPSVGPTALITVSPSCVPTACPSILPSFAPSSQNANQSNFPSALPTILMEYLPTVIPSAVPSVIPSSNSGNQSMYPTCLPSVGPTIESAAFPTVVPTADPTTQHPSVSPTELPTSTPSIEPSVYPTLDPSADPSVVPTVEPSANPSATPTVHPTADPTVVPTVYPTADPSVQPTVLPSADPTVTPSSVPTPLPSTLPTATPSVNPTANPTTRNPTPRPTRVPTSMPTTSNPTAAPTALPSVLPTTAPTFSPTKPGDTIAPTTQSPTFSPTSSPTRLPTVQPTVDDLTPYYQSSLYTMYSQQLGNLTGNVINFGSFNYRGSVAAGQCSEWASFKTGGLQLPFNSMEFSTITYYSKSQNIYNKAVLVSEIFQCTNETAVQLIISSLVSNTPQTVLCDDNLWKVFNTNSGESALSLCVACNEIYVSTSCNTGSSNTLLNPCLPCATRSIASYEIATFQYRIVELYPRIVYPVISQSVAKKSVNVVLNLTAGGQVLCSPVFANSSTPTIATISQNSFSGVAFAKGYVSVSITGLVPSTSYDVYCYTSDFYGNAMPISAVKKFSVTTLCCKSLSFDSSFYLLTENSIGDEDFIGVDILPFQTTLLQFSYTSYSCAFSTLASPSLTFYPSTVLLTASSSTSIGFAMTGSAGCYRITVGVVSGEVYSNASAVVNIRSVLVAPNPPILKLVQFASDGRSLSFSFDSPTDYGATVVSNAPSPTKCSNYMEFASASYFSCYWTSRTVMMVSLSSNATAAALVVVGGNVTLLANVIMPQCDSSLQCSYSSRVTLTISAPATPIVPSVYLQASSLIGACNDLQIDPTASTGHGGRKWSSVSWHLDAAAGSAYPSANMTTVRDFLQTNYDTGTASIITIPNRYLLSGAIYRIFLTVTNFLGTSGTGVVTVQVSSDSSLPIVTIAGATSIQTTRSQSLTLLAVASFKTCSGVAKPVVYNWAVYNGFEFASSIVSSSKDARIFKLSSYVLLPATSYTVRVSVSASGSSIATASVSVQVGKLGCTAAISGGSLRTAGYDSTVVIDASSSYDADYPTSGLLNYTWTCSEYYPTYGLACPTFPNFTASAISFPAGLLLDATSASSYASFIIKVRVSNSYASSSDRVVLTVKRTALPSVAIFKPSTLKFSATSSIALSSVITATSGTYLSWSCLEKTLSLGDALTSTTMESKARNVNFPLAISSGVLTAGVSYTFQLSASYISFDSDLQAFATISVVMNLPPLGGTISVSPLEGTALSDSFFIATSSWSDDSADYPIMYVLSYYTYSASSVTVVKNLDQTSYVSSVLGQGISSLNYAVVCVATAYDIYSDSSTVSTSVKVTPVHDVSSVSSAAQTAVTSALSLGNPAAVSQVIGAAVSSLNSVNCSVVKKCSLLKRNDCFGTPYTCGACMTGYIGAHGDSNSACFAAKGKRRLLDSNTSCVADDDCTLASCVNSTCIVLQKSCPADCSGAGECIYLDPNNDRVSSCSVVDSNCRAVCRCQPNLYGSDCSRIYSSFQSMVSLREVLCEGLYSTLSLQDVTSDVVVARANSVLGLLSDNSQVSTRAAAACGQVLVETILASPALAGATSSTVSLLLDGISLVLLANYSSLEVSNITLSLSKLVSGINSGMVQGQTFSSIYSSALRFSSGILDVQELAGTEMTPAQNDVESYFGVSVPTVTVSSYSESELVGSVGVGIMQFLVNPHGVYSQSNGIGLQFDPSSGDIANALTNLTTVLPNINPVYYHPRVSRNSTVWCDESEGGYNVSVLCPMNYMYSVQCPGTFAGTVNYTCPYIYEAAVCTLWNGTSYDSSLCQAVGYSSESTTCVCNGESTDRRKLLGSINFTSTSMMQLSTATEVVVENSISISFSPLFDMADSVEYNFEILKTVLVIVGVLMTITVVQVEKDKMEADLFGVNNYALAVLTASDKTGNSWRTPPPKVEASLARFIISITPYELMRMNWVKKLFLKLSIDHDFGCFFSSYSYKSDFRYIRFLRMSFKLLTSMLIAAILITSSVNDDGYCEGILDRDTCVTQSSLFLMEKRCEWTEFTFSAGVCGYNGSLWRHSSAVLVATFILTVCSIPVMALVNMLLHKTTGLIAPARSAEEAVAMISDGMDGNHDGIENAIPSKSGMQDSSSVDDQHFLSHNDERLPIEDGPASQTPKVQPSMTRNPAFDPPESSLAVDHAKVTNYPGSSLHIHDLASQSKQDRYLRAALLVVQQQVDASSVDQEAEALALSNAAAMNESAKTCFPENSQALSDVAIRHALLSGNHFTHLPPQFVADYGSDETLNRQQLISTVVESREKAEFIKNGLSRCSNDIERNELLFNHFMVNLWPGFRSTVLANYLRVPADYSNSTFEMYFSMAILWCYLVAAVIVIVVLGTLHIGSRSVPLWMLATFLSLAQEVLMIEPVAIYLASVAIPSIVQKGYDRTKRYISRIASKVISRRRGVLLRAPSSIQHVNPACRAARSYPWLPVSRLLFSLKDSDLPLFLPIYLEAGHHQKVSKDNEVTPTRLTKTKISSLLLKIFFSVPLPIQLVVIQIFVSVSIGFALILLSEAAAYSIAIPISIGVVIGFCCLILAYLSTLKPRPKPAYNSSTRDALIWESDYYSKGNNEDSEAEEEVGVGLGFDAIYSKSTDKDEDINVFTMEDAAPPTQTPDRQSQPEASPFSSIGSPSSDLASESRHSPATRGRGRGAGRRGGLGGRASRSTRLTDNVSSNIQPELSQGADEAVLGDSQQTIPRTESVRYENVYLDAVDVSMSADKIVPVVKQKPTRLNSLEEIVAAKVHLHHVPQPQGRGRGRGRGSAVKAVAVVDIDSSSPRPLQQQTEFQDHDHQEKAYTAPARRNPPPVPRINSGLVDFKDEAIFVDKSVEIATGRNSPGPSMPAGDSNQGARNRSPAISDKFAVRGRLAARGRGGRIGAVQRSSAAIASAAPFDDIVMPNFGEVMTASASSCNAPSSPLLDALAKALFQGTPSRENYRDLSPEKLGSTDGINLGLESRSVKTASPPRMGSGLLFREAVSPSAAVSSPSRPAAHVDSLTRTLSSQKIVATKDWFNLETGSESDNSEKSEDLHDMDDLDNDGKHPLDSKALELSGSSEEDGISNINIRLSKSSKLGANYERFNDSSLLGSSSERGSQSLQKAARLLMLRKIAGDHVKDEASTVERSSSSTTIGPSSTALLSKSLDTGLSSGPAKSFLPVANQLKAALARSREAINNKKEVQGGIVSAKLVAEMAKGSSSSAAVRSRAANSDSVIVHDVSAAPVVADSVSNAAVVGIGNDSSARAPPPLTRSPSLVRKASVGRLSLEHVLKQNEVVLSRSPSGLVRNKDDISESVSQPAPSPRNLMSSASRRPISFDVPVKATESPEQNSLRAPRLRLRDVMVQQPGASSSEPAAVIADDEFDLSETEVNSEKDKIPARKPPVPKTPKRDLGGDFSE